MASDLQTRAPTANLKPQNLSVSTASMSGVPQFKDNLRVDIGQVVPSSGTRAQSEVYGQMATLSKDISDFAGNIYKQQQVEKAKRGEISEADLPSPYTEVGAAVRQGFADGQTIQTNIEIKNKISEITNNDALSEQGMNQALLDSANIMAANHIPEIADTIRQSFASTGVSAIYNVSKERIAKQRAAQDAGLVDSQKYWEDEYTQAFAASQKNQILINDYKDKTVGPLPANQDDYIKTITGIDSTADKRLADAQANLTKTYGGRVALGTMSPQAVEIAGRNLAVNARDEFLAVEAADKGVHYLDNVTGLKFEDRLKIATKAATYAGILNNEEDRNKKLADAASEQTRNQQIQIAKDKAASGDFVTARSIMSTLAKQNETVGSDDFGRKIDAANADINTFGAAGGESHPELFNDYKRQIQIGKFRSIDDIAQDLRFTGKVLNPGEIADLRETIIKIPETDLSSSTFAATQKLVQLRLPDDPKGPSPLARAFGATKSDKQIEVEAQRNRINDGLISGVLNKTLVTPQQQQDYVESQIKNSKMQIYAPEIKMLKESGLTKDSTDIDIMAYAKKLYPSVDPAVPVSPDAMNKAKELAKAQMIVRSTE